MSITDQYVTAKEAAAKLGIHPNSLSFLCQTGKLPAERIANRWLIPRESLELFALSYEGKPGRPRKKRKDVTEEMDDGNDNKG